MLLFRTFVAEASHVPTGSMLPTIQVGDRILVAKYRYGLKAPFLPLMLLDGAPPRPGEIVVFMDPRDPDAEDLVKRVVAVGGDLVEVRRGRLLVNGAPVPRRPLPGPCSYLEQGPGITAPRIRRCVAFEEQLGAIRYRTYHDPRVPAGDMDPVQVPPGHLFVMGDSRDNSSDSRVWGYLPLSHVKGRAVGVLWSWEPGEGPRWRRFFSSLKGL